MGVDERFIAITTVSVGTSIPELAASIFAVLKKEKAISLGNLIGSNIFNILAVLGLTSIVSPIVITNKKIIENDLWWVIIFSIIILILPFIRRKNKIGRAEGIGLLLIYIIFITILFFN